MTSPLRREALAATSPPIRQAGVYVATIALLTAAILAWEAAGMRGALPFSVPSPSQIWDELVTRPGLLIRNAIPTLLAATLGFLIAAALALSIGVLTVVWPRMRGPIYNAAVTLYGMPLLALMPILIVWFGIGATTRTAVAVIASFFPILAGTIQGLEVAQNNKSFTELFTVLSATNRQRFTRQLVPNSTPYILAGLKAASASAVLGAIIAEWTGAERGLGVMMIFALFSINVPRVWLTILASVALSIGAYALVAVLEKAVLRRRPGLGGEYGTVAASTVEGTREPSRQRTRGPMSVLMTVVITVVSVVLVWQAAISVFHVPSYIMPGPAEVAETLFIEEPGALLSHAWYTVRASAVGLALSSVAAIALAGLVVTYSTMERVVMPFSVAIRSLPIVAIAPLITLFVGRGFKTSVVAVFIVAFFPVLVNAVQGFNNVSDIIGDLILVLGAGRWQRFRLVRFPFALPFIFTGWRTAAATAVLGAMLAEWLTGTRGLGFLLLHGAATRQLGLLWAVVVLSAALSLTVFWTTSSVERTVARRMQD